jgi:hypothetical protein
MNGLVPISLSRLQALVAVAGERASMRFLEFFAANIRNPHTRRASRGGIPGARAPAYPRSPPSSRCTSPPGSRRRHANWPHPRSNNGSPACVSCSTGWSTARSCRSTRHTRCAGLGMS